MCMANMGVPCLFSVWSASDSHFRSLRKFINKTFSPVKMYKIHMTVGLFIVLSDERLHGFSVCVYVDMIPVCNKARR